MQQRRCKRGVGRARWKKGSFNGRAKQRSDVRAQLWVQQVEHQPSGSGLKILSGCSFTAPSSGLTLICGKSGTGKTSLLHVLSGLAEPLRGNVSVSAHLGDTKNSSDVHTPPWERMKRCGLVFQFPERHFIGETVREELVAGLVPSQSLQMQATHAVYATGLHGIDLLSNLDELSGGFKRRLALAVQLVRSPSVLLLDEPLAGLDFQSRDAIVALLGSISKTKPVIVRTQTYASREQTCYSCWSW